MVTATKSLFQNLADNPNIVDTFQVMSRNLKDMNLQRMGMAMTMLKISDYVLKISSAGIPGMLVYRAGDGKLEEIEIPGLPLGYTTQFPYEEQQVELERGDTVLLMSDGLPEQRNPAGEMLGFERVQQLFRQIADQAPEAICQYLAQKGEEWAADRPQDDDITFVVFKVR